ncbi:MAG: Gfo/Idh/MocA family oxidoreductase, partial [Planctomycetota bacterium]
LGDVRAIHSFFSFFDDDPTAIVNRREWGGGGVLDIGCYSVSLSRFLFGSEPTRVIARLEYDPVFNVDTLASGILEFAGGASTFACSTGIAESQRVDAYGTRGRLEIEIPFNPPTDRPCRAWLEVDGVAVEQMFDVCDHYGIQATLFSRAIRDDAQVPTPIDDAVSNMRAIDALFRSGDSGGWERP